MHFAAQFPVEFEDHLAELDELLNRGSEVIVKVVLRSSAMDKFLGLCSKISGKLFVSGKLSTLASYS